MKSESYQQIYKILYVNMQQGSGPKYASFYKKKLSKKKKVNVLQWPIKVLTFIQ